MLKTPQHIPHSICHTFGKTIWYIWVVVGGNCSCFKWPLDWAFHKWWSGGYPINIKWLMSVCICMKGRAAGWQLAGLGVLSSCRSKPDLQNYLQSTNTGSRSIRISKKNQISVHSKLYTSYSISPQTWQCAYIHQTVREIWQTQQIINFKDICIFNLMQHKSNKQTIIGRCWQTCMQHWTSMLSNTFHMVVSNTFLTCTHTYITHTDRGLQHIHYFV